MRKFSIKEDGERRPIRANFVNIALIIVLLLMTINLSQAASITTNISETNMNTTIQLNGTGFVANTIYYIIPLLENKSAWWDSYAENWFFNDTTTNNTITVTTNSSGGFTYNMYIPNDWRVSGGKVTFKIGESVASSLLWSTQGTNWAATQPTKNGITGDSDPNGYVYTASNVGVINQGGIEKFYKSNGTKACNYTYGVASNINDITNDGNILYGVTSGGNILKINATDCSFIGVNATAAVVAYSVNVAPNNLYIIITYASGTVPRKYTLNGTGTLYQNATFVAPAMAAIAYDSCISPDGNTTYIGYANGNVTALNSSSGALLWNSDPPETELGNSGYAFPVYGLSCDDTRVYLARGSVAYPVGITEQGFVEALWATNGSRAWINSKTDTAYDGMDVNNIRCDTTYCYAVKANTPAIYSGVMGSAIVQINKTDGNITWLNWRSWLPTTYNGSYGTGGTHSSLQTLWFDLNTTGYLYPVYTNGWVQKIAKNDINVSTYDPNLWIRGSTNFWNYIADVQKNIWLSNETPYYTFRHWNQQGVPLNTNNGSINGTFFRFSMLNTFNSFTAAEYNTGNGLALFIDPVIQVVTTQRSEVQYFNGTYHAACPNTRYAPGLAGWNYQDRACHYNEIPATLAGFNIGTTINGTFITGIFYSLIKTKFWDNYSITKYSGTDNWAWAEWHNTTNNQTLGFATKFGSDQEDVYSDNYGRAVLFYNNAAGNAYYRPQFRADLNRKSDTYIFFLPKTPDPNNTIGEDTMWRRVDIETQKVANPVNITLAQEDSGSFSISGNTYARRINFTAIEPNMFNRSNEPVEIIFNATGGIRSDCQDVIITDTSDTPILLWQVDNFTTCSQNTNISVWIMMNWTQNESKSLRLYYNSSGATPTPTGTTDLIVSTAGGACGTNNHEVNINSSNWYYWARPAALAPANEITRYNFNDTTTNMWTSATHYQINSCYKNINATGTGAGTAGETCGSAVSVPVSRCLAAGSTGKIFAKLNATAAMTAIANRNVTVDTMYVEYYFFANTGRVRIRTQLNKSLPILNTTVSKNWPPYYYFSINTLVPPSGANAWTYYSGLYEQMKKPVATFNSDYTEANLSSGPLPLMFYIKYDGINNIPQANGSILRSAGITDSYWDKGCTAHKQWQYYVYTGGASYGTAAAPLYTSEFISCSKDIASSLPEMGEPGYVNVIPEMAWDDTNVNRWYDPSLVGKFYMQPNLYRPYNRENRFLAPYAITNPYSTSARISSYIIPVCPEKEYGYKGYDDFLTDLPNLLADTSIHIRNNTNNIPCAAQIIKFTDQRGSDGTQIIFARNLSVIVGETISAGWTYPFNTHASGTYTLQANGELDMTFAQKATTTTGYYGKYYFTYTPNNYVIHTFSTSGNPQSFTAPTTGASHNVRYGFAPEAFYTKKVYDESTLWDKESQNFTYYRNPCWLGRYNNIYGSTETGHPAQATLSTPGWQNPMFAAGYTCARNDYNMEIQDVFRPAWSSLYPTAAAAGVMTENMVDGRMNFAGTSSPPGGTDNYMVARHNSLYDYKHNDDFNNILDDTSNLNQDEKHPNKQPWTCQISRHTNRSFCVLTTSLSGLIYNSNPGAGLAAAQPWSPYWTSTAELSTFRHYYMPRFFDTSGWQWTYDHLLEVNIYPGLNQDEVMMSNLLYTSDNPDDYSTFFNKQSSQATLGLQQTQFLLKDWKNSVFFVFNRDSRTYSPGTEMNITGVAIRNGEYFANKNFSVGLYLNNGSVVIINNSVNSTDEGFFSLSFNITNNVSSGLHYILLNYNDSEFTDSVPVMITNLIATITNDKAAYEQGQTVYTNPITITNSLTGALTDPEQLEIRYINPSSTVIECAKYPSTASVPSCDYNLTRTGIGTYSYNISLGSNSLGTYTVKATVTNEGVTADYIRRFVIALIDPCQPNSLYNYALTYPMYYDNTSDTLIVIGNSTFGNSTNPITTEDMYTFAQATKGTCIIDKPTTGTYTIKSRLAVGNGTQEAYIRSKGETISFSSNTMPQLFINQSGHMTFGSVLDGIPQEGSNIKFETNQTNDILLDVAGGELAFYDCYVGDVGNYWGRFMYRGSCGILAEENSSVNSTIIIKKTTFDRASRGQFFFTGNVTIDDMKINRVNSSSSEGYGLVAGCGLPILNNLQIYHQSQNGSGIFISNVTPSNTTLIIQNSFLGHNIADIIANEDGRGVNLVNTEWDRTYGFNWTGAWSGTTSIKESYSYLPTFLDISSQGIENITVILLDRLGNVQLVQKTNTTGEIPEQYINTWQVEKTISTEIVSSFNPYTSYAKKYGITLLSEPKLFASKKAEIKQLFINPFITKSELQAAALANITYNLPTKVVYGTEYNDSWTVSGQLKHYPIDQCQYFALFANETLLSKDVDYSINYETGAITFLQDYTGYTIYPVYFYGGNITITNGFTLMNALSMNDIYDYTQYQTSQNNLTEDVYTIDGTTYTFCVDLVVGNSTNQGSLSDSDATLTFNDGYDFAFDGLGGFVDLAGITAGGGTNGGLPLNIFDNVGSNYAPGSTAYLFSTVMNSQGNLVDATVSISVYYPNGTLYSIDSSTRKSLGRFEYNISIPSDAPIGTWLANIDAIYSGTEVHDNLVFTVSTSAGGGGGGVLPTIQIDAPSIINTNTNFGIVAFAKNNNSLMTNCDSGATLTITNSINGSIILNGVAMTNSATGQYNYTLLLPYQATFLASVNCSISGTSYTSNPKIISSQNAPGGSGSAYPTIEIEASTPIATLTNASIGALVKSSSGTISNCDASLGITIRDMITGMTTNGTMTNFGTGMYNYTWQTPITASVFYINTSCSISGTSYTGFTVLSTQSAGAQATVDYNQIALYVWNSTARNLTYYNQSAADSIQSCLKDAVCSGWWLNTTLTNVQSTISALNTTIIQINNSAQIILSYQNCTTANDVCTRLQNILNNATDIQSRVYALNVTQIPALQTSIGNIFIDTQFIRNNMANATALLAYTQDLNNSLWWLRNNVVNQTTFNANMTSIMAGITTINTTTQNIQTMINCSNPANSVLCGYLSSINQTANNIQTNMVTYAQVQNISNDTQWIRNNMINQTTFNANMTTIIAGITAINTTTQNIQSSINCSNPANSVLCGYLNNINTTANNIQTNMATSAQVNNVLGNTSWLISNVATSTEIQNNFTQTLNKLNGINSTIQTIYSDLLSTNQTLSQQVLALGVNLSWIRDNVATSTEIQNNFTQTLNLLGIINNTVSNAQSYLYGEITNRLTEINTTTNNTQSYLYGEITNSLSGLNNTLNQTYSVVNNMSLQQNNTQVLDELNSLQQNLTFIRNNMFYQGNATGSFLVDYASTPYTENNNRAELWIQTRDLLGNSKTVVSAECNISQRGITIANANVNITPGNVYAYWNVPSGQSVGEYYWNCILTGSTMNLYVPFFVAPQKIDFSISALVSGSPRYPNEDVLVEVMFSGLNGSAVEPDTINLTIYDTNNNAWANASKASFTKNADNIWQYSKSIEANPTTGMYTIHLYATYQGVTESKSTQFRIATGGPYKVYIDCPSSAYVGQNLGCTVIIQDEGEAATESITTVWVDINNNGVNDTGEPRMSFSKSTVPFQTVTQPITLNIPSSQALGLFMVQADTEYVNSAQPHSKASDSVLFSVAPPSTGTGTGGGAGGGTGGAIIVPESPIINESTNTNDGGGRGNNLNLTNAQVYLSGSIVCNKPYIRKGAECCLDLNTNAICDYDERTPSQYPNPEENKGIMRLFTDQQLYLTILVIGLCFLVLLIFLIFLLMPNYVKRMRKALLTEKEMKKDEEETKQYLKEYMNIYKNPDTQIYGSMIQDSENKRGEIHIMQERTPMATVDLGDKEEEKRREEEIRKREEEKRNIEIKERLKEEMKEEERRKKEEEKESQQNSHEPYLNIKKNTPEVKEVYGEKRFFMNDGMFISSLVQLVVVLENLDVEAFNRHVNDHKNDFYNWVYDTFQDKQLAAKIKDVRNKKEMADIIKDHLLRE